MRPPPRGDVREGRPAVVVTVHPRHRRCLGLRENADQTGKPSGTNEFTPTYSAISTIGPVARRRAVRSPRKRPAGCLAPRRVAGNCARWATALGRGLRQSEALALRWSDSDLDAGALTVNRPCTGSPVTESCSPSRNRSGPVGASRSPSRWSTCSGPTARRSSPSGCGRVTGGRTATYQHVLPALGRDAADQMGRRCRTRWHTNWHAADHGRKVRAGHRGWS